MKFIIPIFILFLCFSCNSPSNSKSDTNTQDSVSTNSEINTEVKIETKNELITVGTDSVLFKSSGTEPFWVVEVRKSGILFSNFEDSTLFIHKEPISAVSRPVEYFMTYFLEDKEGNMAQLVAKRGENCPCSDGMSDNDYEYHVSFLYKNKMWEGCGETVVRE
jgi:uncharacterized membrane protein